jgi:hypothetical protein
VTGVCAFLRARRVSQVPKDWEVSLEVVGDGFFSHSFLENKD